MMRVSVSLAAVAACMFGNGGLADTVPQAMPFPSSCKGVSAMRYTHQIHADWQITKLAGGLRQPRTVVFDPHGNMLVLQATSGISVHTFGPDGCINKTSTLVANRGLNHALTLTPDGQTLYASSETTAWQWRYDAAAMAVADEKVVVRGMAQGVHSTRTMVVVPQKPNLVLLQVGANNNWDYGAASPSAGRAIVKVFDMDTVPAGGYSYNTGGTVFGYGMRNEIGLAVDPAGHVWGVENSGDDFRRTVNGAAKDIHKDNPAEKLNYLGDPTDPKGTWFGYPTCFAVWEPSLITDTAFKTGDQFVVTPNATFGDKDCVGQATPPRLSFQAHSAPIAAAFDVGATNLYVTFHGSWDRQPGTGYKLVQVPFTKLASELYDPVASADSQKGYNDILWAQSNACQSQSLTISSCWRLAAATWDPAGTRLILSSDNSQEGELFVLAKKAA
ncbi:Six-bladed beta-propeller, TolB-like protein [Niveomyces insectorum RCEF 264]|uniref:Six-bladed beta-propeller, TolB-like protein n=1 Tax=Niveomyces insectorum RCEF 264 TaxID=1081102 RepID=A0A167ZVB1_9HYPO|nr:Six-bladed beta-propeller, TolB-like protein [Niveomyces insectorum RCEF 264]